MNKKLTLLIAMAMAGTSGAAFAQASDTESTDATARIMQAITVAEDSELAFGSVIRSAAAGTNTVTISATTGARSISGGGGGVLASSTSGRATYTVSGEGGQTFSITPDATFALTRSGGTETITVTSSSSAASGTLSGAAGASGTATFGVGGSFDVSDTTPIGSYAGTFNVTVAYN